MKKKSAAKKEEQHRPPPHEPYPWLVYSFGDNNNKQIFCSISNPNETCIRRIPALRNRYFWANCHGWCLYLGRDFCLILWNPVTMEKITLPCMPEVAITDCILTSPPSEPGCKVILFFDRMNNILYCELGDEEWTELCYYDELKRTIKEVGQAEETMVPTLPNLLISPVCCDGNLYAVWTPFGNYHDCCRKLVKIHEIHRDGLKIEPLNVFLRSARPKHVHLMESCGDLFTVEIQYKDESFTGVLAIGIHRLNFSNKEWVQVETAKDRAFFLPLDMVDQQAFSIPVIDPDVANRVYFTLHGDDTCKKLYSYNIEDGTISISSTFLNLPRLQRSCPVWIMPGLR